MVVGYYYLHKHIYEDTININNNKIDNNKIDNNKMDNGKKLDNGKNLDNSKELDNGKKLNNGKKLDNSKINTEITRSKTSKMLRNKSMDNFLKFQWPWII